MCIAKSNEEVIEMKLKHTVVVVILTILFILNFVLLGLLINGVVDIIDKRNASTEISVEKSETSLFIESNYLETISELKHEIDVLNNKINEIARKLEIAENKNAEYEEFISSSICLERLSFPLDLEYKDDITSTQGLRDPIALPNAGGTTSGKYHNAIDVAVPDFTPVYAAESGRIVEVYPSYYNGGAEYRGHPVYGGYIEIEHDDGTFSTIYAHLSMTSVREGDFVKTGEKIGYSGGVAGRRGSGQSTGPHLHFEIILNINNCF